MAFAGGSGKRASVDERSFACMVYQSAQPRQRRSPIPTGPANRSGKLQPSIVRGPDATSNPENDHNTLRFNWGHIVDGQPVICGRLLL